MKDSNPPEIQTAVLAAILENAVDAIINITPQGIIDSVNPAAVEMFGFSADEMIGHNIKMLMPNPYRDEHDGYLAKYNAGGPRKIIGVGREVTGQRKNGSTFPMHLAVSEIKVDDKHLFTGIVRDISDLKCAEQELAAANEQLAQSPRAHHGTDLDALIDIATTTDQPIVIQSDSSEDIGVINKTTLLKGIQGGKA